jgi:hypothetical protein
MSMRFWRRLQALLDAERKACTDRGKSNSKIPNGVRCQKPSSIGTIQNPPLFLQNENLIKEESHAEESDIQKVFKRRLVVLVDLHGSLTKVAAVPAPMVRNLVVGGFLNAPRMVVLDVAPGTLMVTSHRIK